VARADDRSRGSKPLLSASVERLRIQLQERIHVELELAFASR
jgi:hypothetical protein